MNFSKNRIGASLLFLSFLFASQLFAAEDDFNSSESVSVENVGPGGELTHGSIAANVEFFDGTDPESFVKVEFEESVGSSTNIFEQTTWNYCQEYFSGFSGLKADRAAQVAPEFVDELVLAFSDPHYTRHCVNSSLSFDYTAEPEVSSTTNCADTASSTETQSKVVKKKNTKCQPVLQKNQTIKCAGPCKGAYQKCKETGKTRNNCSCPAQLHGELAPMIAGCSTTASGNECAASKTRCTILRPVSVMAFDHETQQYRKKFKLVRLKVRCVDDPVSMPTCECKFVARCPDGID